MTDELYTDLPFLTSEDTAPVIPTPRPCRRHEWQFGGEPVDLGVPDAFGNRTTIVATERCRRCGKVKDPVLARRGRLNRSRGNSIEREVAAKLGLRRVGQFGGPTDVSGDYLVIQVKSGAGFPERTWGWLQAMTADAGQTRAVVLTDAPGPGRKRRALICLDLEDWVSWHGPTGGTR